MSVEGIPDGWELVAFRKAMPGDWFINPDGHPEQWLNSFKSNSVYAIIRKIEKPKRYRPFANAAEFEPFRDRWFTHKGKPDHHIRTSAYNDRKHWSGEEGDTWEAMLDRYVFDDGTPFGIEVTE